MAVITKEIVMGMRRIDHRLSRRKLEHPYMSKSRIREKVLEAMHVVSDDEISAIAESLNISNPTELKQALKYLKVQTQAEVDAKLQRNKESLDRIKDTQRQDTVEQTQNKVLDAIQAESDALNAELRKAKTDIEKKKIMARYATRNETPKIEVGNLIINGEFNIDLWVDQRAAALKKRNLLMTDRQLNDLETGRKYKVGDKAIFIGETRIEKIENVEIERPSGQKGTIIEVGLHQGAQIVRFRPKNSLPDLVIREYTPGFLDLERFVEHE